MELSNMKTKLLIIVVALFIIIEAVWAYQTIVKTNPPVASQTTVSPSVPKILNVISLTASKTQFKIGEVIPVEINVESNTLTAGADLIIHYDLNLLSISPNSLKTPVTLGSLYDEYPINQIDEKSGIITISGISTKTGGVIPKGIFGTILFQAKAAGSAKIFLEFTKGNTNDTNLIDSKTSGDVLEEVKNLDLTIIP